MDLIFPQDKNIQILTREEAKVILSDAWWGGKNKKLRRFNHDFTGNSDGSGYVIAAVALSKIVPNEAGERYDGTVFLDRAKEYATIKILTPVHLLYGVRLQKRTPFAYVLDGGHRVSAARMRGDDSIQAIMQVSHYEALHR